MSEGLSLTAAANLEFLIAGKPTVRTARIPTEDVVPFAVTSFIPQDHLLRDGWPDVPDIWIRGTGLVSSDGTYIDSDRPSPFDVLAGAHARFIASPASWDEITGIWNPYYTNGISYQLTSPSGQLPVLERISYISGREMLTRDAMRLVPGSILVSGFNAGRDNASTFGIAMVVNLHSPTGYHVLSFTGQKQIDVVLNDSQLWLYFEGRRASASMQVNPVAVTPMVIVLAVTPSSATLYAGGAVNRLTSVRLDIETVSSTKMAFIIGSDNTAGSNASMHLMDLSVHDARLNVLEVAGAYTTAYGEGA